MAWSVEGSRMSAIPVRRNLRSLVIISALVLSLSPLPLASSAHDAALFELDGNATASGAPGDDWSTLFPTNTSSTVFSKAFTSEPAATDTSYFSVGSKDILDIDEWSATGNSAPPKDEIVDAFAAAYNHTNGASFLYFGADRWANNGDAAIGFWFFQDEVAINPDGSFSGQHVVDDLFIVSDFTNGGTIGTISLFRWNPAVNNNLELLATGGDCTGVSANDGICARVNSADTASPWPFQSKGTKDPPNVFQEQEFFEGGLNLTAFYGQNVPCFHGLLAETRSSQETTATLKDLLFQSFGNCPVVPPLAIITVEKFAAAPAVDLGQPIGFSMIVTNSGPDPAENTTLWDDLPAVSGTWTDDSPDCAITGRNLTCDFGTLGVFDQRFVNVTAGTAAIADCGPWVNVVRISANDGLANDQSQAETYVTCADVGVVKTGGDPVHLGEDLTFSIVVTSYGPDAAADVTLDDALPTLSGTWTDDSADCAIAEGDLSCAWATIEVGGTRYVNLTGTTGEATDCGLHPNTATVGARVDTNGSNNASSASQYVLCADVGLDKTAGDDDLYLGSDVSFTLTVTSNGPDAAEDVTITDTLPEPPGSWTISDSDDSCSILDGVLSCAFGTVPVGETRSVTVNASTGDAETDCGAILNAATASATADIDGSNDNDAATITVRCSDVTIEKTASATVYLGGDVEFTITVTSLGPDAALNAGLTDTLPAEPGGWQVVESDDFCSIGSGVLTCEFGTIPAGEARDVTIRSGTGAVADCGAVDNSATAGADVDTDGTNNGASASTTVLCSDVSLTKTAADETIDVGDTASFTLTLTSNGPDPAQNAGLTDTLPATANAWTDDVDDCSIADGVLSCAFGTLAPGASRSVTVSTTTTLADCGALPNSGLAFADVDIDPTNNSDAASIYVTCADVSVEKTAADDTIDVGGTASFTITVTSNGPDAAENVTLSDTLPALAGGWSEDSDDCSITDGVLACAFGTLASGATRSVTLTGETGLDDCGDLDNTATVGARLDTDATNNADSASIHVTCADVSVEKTAADDGIDVGDVASFTITLSSNGPDAATGAGLSDTLPATTNGWAESSDDCSISDDLLTCAFGSVPAGETRSVTVTTTTTLDDCGALDNLASVTADVDTDATNNEDSASIYVTCADVGIEKSAANDTIDVGESASFTITVTSYGPDAATNVAVTDTLPATAGEWTDDSDDCSITGDLLTCAFGTIPAEGSRSVIVSSATTLVDCGLLPNNAGVSADVDTDPTNNEDGASIYVTCADVSIEKSAAQETIDVGGTLSFTITVTSNGPDAAEGVTIGDVLPVVSGTWTDDSDDCEIVDGVLGCSFGTLASGASRSVTISAGTTVEDCGPVSNLATALARLDTNGENNEDGASIYVTCADVSALKIEAEATINVFGNATFTVTVTSEGPDAAENVTITDVLPPIGTSWSYVTPDGGSCLLESGTLTCSFGTLQPDEMRRVVITGTTTLDDCGLITNFASASARLNTDQTNDQDSASVYVTCADVSVLKTAGDGAIDVGEDASFTLTLTSLGPDDATGASLVDVLGDGWSIAQGDDGDDCAILLGTLTCDFGTVPAGETRTVTVSRPTTLDDCSGLLNEADASAALDTDGTNNADDATIDVTCADVSVEKTAADDEIDVGGTASFTLTVTSNGPDAAEDVTLTDALPALAGGWTDDSDDCTITDGVLSCSFGTLAPDATRSVTLTGATSLDDCGALDNTASVTARVDTDASNNEGSASIYVRCADVSIAKTATAETIDVGDDASFGLTVTSLGPDEATDVTLDDVLGDGWSIVAGGDGDDCAITLGTLSCDFGTVPASESRTVTVARPTTLDDCDGVFNEASVAAALDTDAENNDATASIEVTCADVTVSKDANLSEVIRGMPFEWRVIISSLGPDAAEDITVTDIVPAATVLGLSGDAAAYCSNDAGTITCDIDSLDAGASLTLVIESVASGLDCAPFTNTATVGARLDTNGTNNGDGATIEVTCPLATRTLGFWSTHTQYTQLIFADVFSGTMPIGEGSHLRTIDSDGKLFGSWYSAISSKTTGQKRNPIDQARMVLLQQLTAAKLNCGAFGCSASDAALIAEADTAYAGNNKAVMANVTARLDAYNNGGDAVPLPTTWGWQGPSTPDVSRALADRAFWDSP